MGAALLIGLAFSVLPGSAAAHHPEVFRVSAVCGAEAGTARIDYTVGAWSGRGDDPTNDPSRANSDVQVSLSIDRGSYVEIARGAFVAPSYSFGGSVVVSSGGRYKIKVTALAPWGNGRGGGEVRRSSALYAPDCAAPEATPTPAVTPTSTPSPTPTASPTPTPTASPTPTVIAGPEPTASPTPTPTASPTPTPTTSGTPTPTASPTPTPTASPTPTPTASPTPTPTASPTPTPTASPTPTPTASPTPTPTASPTPTSTASPTPTPTVSPTATPTPTVTVNRSPIPPPPGAVTTLSAGPPPGLGGASVPLPANAGEGPTIAETTGRGSLGWLLLATATLIFAASVLGGSRRAR